MGKAEKDRPGDAGATLVKNLFAPVPVSHEEWVENLLVTGAFRLERIVSTGQVSPPGFWYDQAGHEWVVLLSGGARLQVEGQADEVTLRPGDYLFLPAHCRHRVTWTAVETVWLALFFDPET